MTIPRDSKCPVCGKASAPNAIIDARCGPCHNFGIVKFDGYAVLIRFDFANWIRDTMARIVAAKNLESYAGWLSDIQAAHERHVRYVLKERSPESKP